MGAYLQTNYFEFQGYIELIFAGIRIKFPDFIPFHFIIK